MKYDTAGNIIKESRSGCRCGLTGGCQKCNPRESFIGSMTDEEAEKARLHLKKYKTRFNQDFCRHRFEKCGENVEHCLDCGKHQTITLSSLTPKSSEKAE